MVVSPSVGTVQNKSGASVASLTTSAQTVSAGASLYVQVVLTASVGQGAPQISDSQNGTYTLLRNVAERIGGTTDLYIWVWRRGYPVTASTAFTVMASNLSGSTPAELAVVEVLNEGDLDVIGLGSFGGGTTESTTITTVAASDLLLFFGADTAGTFSSWGAGQTGIPYPNGPPTGATAWASHQVVGAPGSTSPQRVIMANQTWVAFGIAIHPQVPWTAVDGRPFATVSAIGLNSTPAASISNNGADFGPDTPGTTTCGIQEALDVAAPSGLSVRLIANGTFGVTSQITVPGNVRLWSDMVGGEAYSAAKSPPPSYISWTGSSAYAVLVGGDSDTAGTVLDGIAVIGDAGGAIGGALVQVQGTRDLRMIDCYLDNTHNVSTDPVYAIECDGGTHNTEHCLIERCQFFANSAGGAIGIGIHDITQHCNDCEWRFITAENAGTGPVVDGLNGGNHNFIDFYSRGSATPVFNARGASFKIQSGELGGTATNQLSISSGSSKVIVQDLGWTSGGISATAGFLDFRGVTINSGGCAADTWILNGSGGGLRVIFEASCDFRNAATGSGVSAGIQFQGGTLYLYGPADLFPRNALSQSGGTLEDLADTEVDNRSVAAADVSAINLFTVAPGAKSAYQVGMVLELTAYNASTGTVSYTLTWTDWDSQTRTLALTASSLHGTSNASQTILIKASTNPTVQVTSSGTWTSTTATVLAQASKTL
jgi:hypothetical protein